MCITPFVQYIASKECVHSPGNVYVHKLMRVRDLGKRTQLPVPTACDVSCDWAVFSLCSMYLVRHTINLAHFNSVDSNFSPFRCSFHHFHCERVVVASHSKHDIYLYMRTA